MKEKDKISIKEINKVNHTFADFESRKKAYLKEEEDLKPGMLSKFFKASQPQAVLFKPLKYEVRPHFLVNKPTKLKPTLIRGKAGYTSYL